MQAQGLGPAIRNGRAGRCQQAVSPSPPRLLHPAHVHQIRRRCDRSQEPSPARTRLCSREVRRFRTCSFALPERSRCSYDGVVRLFDARQLVQPASTVDVGGGVWRLKWHPSRHEKLLVAAMHAGCRLVDLDPSSGQGQIVVRFKEHESMAYGADWSPSGDVVGSCSFYDSKLAFWR